MQNTPKQIGIVGGSGYAAAELVRILQQHPYAEIRAISARQAEGQLVHRVFPNLPQSLDLRFCSPDSPEFKHCDLVFFATPNGVAMKTAPELLEAGTKVVDLGADFRIKDIDLWQQTYAMQHTAPDLVSTAIYGLPEINRQLIHAAQLVANPGCYPTASILALLPLLEQGLINSTSIIVDAKSGVTGAGRKAVQANLFAEVSDSLRAYAASGHRHQPEIESALQSVAGGEIAITFVPHLVPMLRGIHATVYADLVDPQMPTDQIRQIFRQRYSDEHFVELLSEGDHPQTRSVRGSNNCQIGVHKNKHGKLILLSVIDNLVKGAAGQAIQNMNIMFAWDETLALPNIGHL